MAKSQDVKKDDKKKPLKTAKEKKLAKQEKKKAKQFYIYNLPPRTLVTHRSGSLFFTIFFNYALGNYASHLSNSKKSQFPTIGFNTNVYQHGVTGLGGYYWLADLPIN